MNASLTGLSSPSGNSIDTTIQLPRAPTCSHSDFLSTSFASQSSRGLGLAPAIDRSRCNKSVILAYFSSMRVRGKTSASTREYKVRGMFESARRRRVMTMKWVRRRSKSRRSSRACQESTVRVWLKSNGSQLCFIICIIRTERQNGGEGKVHVPVVSVRPFRKILQNFFSIDV